jgi:hypothetical protein
MLLWNDLSTRLIPQEVDEVRRILGSSLIEENEVLNRELMALREMLEQFRSRNDERLERLSRSARFVYETPSHRRLKKDIVDLLERLHVKGETFVEHVRKTSKNDAIVSFLSADSNQSLEPPRRRRSSSFSSTSSSEIIKRPMTPSSSVVDSLLSDSKRKLSTKSIQEVAEAVRASMKEEKRVLELAIKDLNRELEEESNHLTTSIEKVKKSKPPSTDELEAYKFHLSSGSSFTDDNGDDYVGDRHETTIMRKQERKKKAGRGGVASFRSRLKNRVSEARYLS